MPRFFKSKGVAKGLVAGSLIHIGEKKQDEVRIRVMSYDRETLEESECGTLEEATSFIRPGKMTWINIDGIHDAALIGEVGTRFGISPLVLEDIMNTDHRPKFEEHKDHLYITTKLLRIDEEQKIEADQISMLAGDHYILTFQERVGTYFEILRTRIRQAKTRIRSIYTDYMVYALLDCVVDDYMELIGELGAEIELIEETIAGDTRRETAEKIYRNRTEMNFMRKTIRPLREITVNFLKSDSRFLRPETDSYFNDLNDHVIAALEAVDLYQNMTMDQYNMYNTNLSNRSNEIMKTLTIFASIFIPLTFVAGIYGMNFEHIPELGWQKGYLYFWGLIFIVGISLVIYFIRKRWF
jgi:magnesium transporter